MDNNRHSHLNRIWLAGGAHRLRREFSALAAQDREGALEKLNDGGLVFPVLFTLMEEARELAPGLSARNAAALFICGEKLAHTEEAFTPEEPGDETLYHALRWMFDTGKDWDGPSAGEDAYDAVIDYTAALLVGTFEDTSVLPDVVGLVFSRNRRGLLIHDLVWGCFQSLTPQALELIARYLLSPNPGDVALAARLLHTDAPEAQDGAARAAYRQYIKWLEENGLYLYVTGEHFQMTSSPRHVEFDREAKYLGREITPRYRSPVEPLSEEELAGLHRYRQAEDDEKELLADYSGKLRLHDEAGWRVWMQMQVAEQVMAARAQYEVI